MHRTDGSTYRSGTSTIACFLYTRYAFVDIRVQEKVDRVRSCMGRITQRFIFVPLPPSHRLCRSPITISQWTKVRRRSESAILLISSFTPQAGSFRISYHSHRKTTWKRPLLQLRNTSKASCNLCCPSSQTSNNTKEAFVSLERARSTC